MIKKKIMNFITKENTIFTLLIGIACINIILFLAFFIFLDSIVDFTNTKDNCTKSVTLIEYSKDSQFKELTNKDLFELGKTIDDIYLDILTKYNEKIKVLEDKVDKLSFELEKYRNHSFIKKKVLNVSVDAN